MQNRPGSAFFAFSILAATIAVLFLGSVAAVPPAGCEPAPNTGSVANFANNDGTTGTFNEVDADTGFNQAPPTSRVITFGSEAGNFPDALAVDEDADVLQYTETLDVVPAVDVMRLSVRMEFVDVPDGQNRRIVGSAWRNVENFRIEVLTPPATWNLVHIVTNSVGTGTTGDFNAALTTAQWNGGDVSVRWLDETTVADVTAHALFIDRLLIETDPINYNLFVICGWIAGTGGGQLSLDAWAQHSGVQETFSLQVRSIPGPVWNTRLTIPVGADGQPSQNYFLTPNEYNMGGTIEIRIVGNIEMGDTDFGIVNVDQLTIFGPPPGTVPEASTVAASGVGATSARLNGNLDDPGFTPTEVYFQYGTTLLALGAETPRVVKDTGGPFSRTVTGLQSDTTYYFRACAENSFAEDCGAILSFTTEESQLAFLQRIFVAVLWALFLIFLVAGALMFRRWRQRTE